MLVQCAKCGFYASSFEKKCLNCGHSVSSVKIAAGYLEIAGKPAFFALFFSLFLALPTTIFLFGSFYGFLQLLTTGLFVYLTAFAVLFWLEFKKHDAPDDEKTDNSLSTLAGKAGLIEKRIAELGNRGRKIDAVLDKIKETDSTQLQGVRERLLSAREVVISQFARYELQRQKIELVRLQNEVSPYLSQLHRLNEVDLENGLTAIEQTSDEINMMRQNLTRYDAIEFPPRTVPEKKNFLAQLAETESSCEKLREALLAKQAMRALQGIQPFEESLHLPTTKDLAHAAETFNIQSTLTDFSESFDELEREYKRLKAEDEASRKLLDE
jgi:membrane protein implicated in regulation of membrane protease activity